MKTEKKNNKSEVKNIESLTLDELKVQAYNMSIKNQEGQLILQQLNQLIFNREQLIAKAEQESPQKSIKEDIKDKEVPKDDKDK